MIELSFYADGPIDHEVERYSPEFYERLAPRSERARRDDAAPAGRNYRTNGPLSATYFIVKDGPRTQEADKAVLIGFGVDGSVPLEQALANAGLLKAANDNTKISAAAAA